MRWLWVDRPAGIVLLVLAAVAFRELLLPAATDPAAPDELLGSAQLAWWALCQLIGASLGLMLLRFCVQLWR
jgi:hypothetical protein